VPSRVSDVFLAAFVALVFAGLAHSQPASYYAPPYYFESDVSYSAQDDYTVTGYSETVDWDGCGCLMGVQGTLCDPEGTYECGSSPVIEGYDEVWAEVDTSEAVPGTYGETGQHYGDWDGVPCCSEEIGETYNYYFVPGPTSEYSSAWGDSPAGSGNDFGFFTAELAPISTDWDGITVGEWGSALTDGCYPYSQQPNLPGNLIPPLNWPNFSQTLSGSWSVGVVTGVNLFYYSENNYGLDQIGLGGAGPIVGYYQALMAAGWMPSNCCGMEGPQSMQSEFAGTYAIHGFGFQIFPVLVFAYRDSAWVFFG
jgi:hypothetical protein